MGCNTSDHAQPEPDKKPELTPKPVKTTDPPVVDTEEANKAEESAVSVDMLNREILTKVVQGAGSMKKILVMGSN